jgi:G3E family GTPase
MPVHVEQAIPAEPLAGRVDYLLVESMGISEPPPAAEPRLGRRTVLTFPLLPPPQKN